MSSQAFHGSDLEKIEKAFGIKKENIVSFSANVNPLGVSRRFTDHVAAHPETFESYPDREYTALRAAIGAYAGISPEFVMVGSGATELISNVIGTISPKNVLMIEPTYSEYARKLSGENAKIHSFLLRESDEFALDMEGFLKEASKDPELIMICNPNNPTGTALTREQIGQICKSTKATVLVDETYVEFAEDVDKISSVRAVKDHKNLIVLRGTSKFFATPGLRLGYMVCADPDMREAIREASDPWSVNSVAAISGGEMFADEIHIKRTREFTVSEMSRVLESLKTLPLHVYEPAANFVLLRIEVPGITSGDIFEFCIRKGLMIRDCASFKSLGDRHIRLCLHTPENNDRLIDALKEILLS